MDYSKVDSDELKEKIYHRQQTGIPDVLTSAVDWTLETMLINPQERKMGTPIRF
jgi:hypothetical protein